MLIPWIPVFYDLVSVEKNQAKSMSECVFFYTIYVPFPSYCMRYNHNTGPMYAIQCILEVIGIGTMNKK